MNPRFLYTLIGAVVLVTIGGFFALNRLGPQQPEPATPGQGSDQPVATTMASTDPGATTQEPSSDPVTNAPKTQPEETGPELPREEWDNQIADLLTDTTIEHREAGQKLAAIAARNNAPEEVRIDAIQHALNLIGDEEYMEDMMTLAVRDDLPEEMQEIIFSDLHNRPQEVSVPVAKEISRLEKHPLALEAKDFVEFFEDDPLMELDDPQVGN